jgi:hypothetical protein
MTKTFYVIQYNDCYGNGYNKKLEAIVESQEQFLEWLKKHNEERKNEYLEDDYLEESIEEFNLIPLQLFNH